MSCYENSLHTGAALGAGSGGIRALILKISCSQWAESGLLLTGAADLRPGKAWIICGDGGEGG